MDIFFLCLGLIVLVYVVRLYYRIYHLSVQIGRLIELGEAQLRAQQALVQDSEATRPVVSRQVARQTVEAEEFDAAIAAELAGPRKRPLR